VARSAAVIRKGGYNFNAILGAELQGKLRALFGGKRFFIKKGIADNRPATPGSFRFWFLISFHLDPSKKKSVNSHPTILTK
jgi:hypothetical protein